MLFNHVFNHYPKGFADQRFFFFERRSEQKDNLYFFRL
jgi:hypothetical protein